MCLIARMLGGFACLPIHAGKTIYYADRQEITFDVVLITTLPLPEDIPVVDQVVA